jgi:dihydroneopterin aldolase
LGFTEPREDQVSRDRIRLNDIVLFAHLGVTEAEREVGQRIHIDVSLETDLSAAGGSDVLADTVSYEAVYRSIQKVVEAHRVKLMETLATRIIETVFGEFPVERIAVRMRKPNVPFAGSLSSAEVEIERSR